MKTILLIEDNPDMRENIAEILELAKYKVITATNGKEGVKFAQHEKPDLIVCDIMMPELDGYGVLHMLGNDSETAGIPFIFLTAKAEKSDQRMGMGMGADDYLTKPFENADLLQAVETRLKKHEILRIEFARTAEGLNDFFKEAQGTDSLKEISDDKERKLYRKKDSLYMETNHPRGVFFITKGKVKTCKSNDNGKEYVTGLYKEGDFIGYTALLEDLPYTDAAIAMEDTEAVIIPKNEFFSLLYSNRDVAAKFIKMLSGNVSEMENRLVRLAYNSVRKRVAEALIMLQERYSKEGENLSMAVSREDLAGLVGTATETVTRTLSDFKDEGIIAIKGSNIAILNQEKLIKMKN
ncbi:MAG: response regulator [Bacteroidota bacterium]|nr:response regulator [Bacteroidota bacterium]